ncbi:MAG: RlmE family RNA methyltransferase [Spirochaetes bacterium]|nr:RlmE family RNA methyltransferase [Spirochaetota bacterium]
MNVYEKPDFYSKKAKSEGFFARSIYKLEEIQDKFHLIKKEQKVLDLGCAPGSWSQFVLSIIQDTGFLVGIDYKQIKISAPNAVFIKGNFLKDHAKEKINEFAPFDGIISDMAPDTTGDKFSDNIECSNLVEEALNFAYDHLKKGGYFIAKIFQGGNENEIMQEIKNAFENVKWFKPKSSRKISNEIFIIAFNYQRKPEKNNINLKNMSDDNYTGEMPW